MQHARYRSTDRDRTRHLVCAEMEPLPSMLYILYTINDKKVKFRILSAVKKPEIVPKTVFMPVCGSWHIWIQRILGSTASNAIFQKFFYVPIYLEPYVQASAIFSKLVLTAAGWLVSLTSAFHIFYFRFDQ